MNKETWKPFQGFPHLMVSNLGNVYHLDKKQLVTKKPNGNIQVWKDGKGKNYSYYKLLKIHFPWEWIKDLDDDEECKEHPTHKGYFFTTKGRCFSLHSYKFCKVGLVKGFPYPRVTIHSQPKLIHIMLLETFRDNPEGFPDVLHYNDVKDDYRLENLYWGEDKKNWEDSIRNGRRNLKSYSVLCNGETLSVSNLNLFCKERNIPYLKTLRRVNKGMDVML